MTEFKQPALKELADQQVRFAPVVRRTEQLAKAEKLLSEIVPDRVYPYQFVCFRVTEFRSAAHPDLTFPGRDLQHDLAAMIRRLERSRSPCSTALSPTFRSRTNKRLTCRSLIFSSSAALRCVIFPSLAFFKATNRSRSA